ncbi:MAG: hypothetical protein Q4F41_19765 [Eubacteriales bacterium]|nr:hypothetical protein [Eubacteriales bacterium]
MGDTSNLTCIGDGRLSFLEGFCRGSFLGGKKFKEKAKAPDSGHLYSACAACRWFPRAVVCCINAFGGTPASFGCDCMDCRKNQEKGFFGILEGALPKRSSGYIADGPDIGVWIL